MCGMIAVQVQIIWGANLIPSGPRAAVTIRAASRHVRACRPMRFALEGSDGGALATPGGGVGACGVDVRPPSDWGISNKKPATDSSVRALQFSL